MRFATDVPCCVDSRVGLALGGFGGIRRNAPRKHVPVVFVHGNNVDAADWYPVRDDFRAAGWTDQELWALSYNGLGGVERHGADPHANPSATPSTARWARTRRPTSPRTTSTSRTSTRFLRCRADATPGSRQFMLVGHSLGVTLAREALRVQPELRKDLVAFVGIAGGEPRHLVLPAGVGGQRRQSCDEIAAGHAVARAAQRRRARRTDRRAG